MLDTIANYKQHNTDEMEKIQIDVNMINKLTENSKYSFESSINREDQYHPTGYFKKQS